MESANPQCLLSCCSVLHQLVQLVTVIFLRVFLDFNTQFWYVLGVKPLMLFAHSLPPRHRIQSSKEEQRIPGSLKQFVKGQTWSSAKNSNLQLFYRILLYLLKGLISSVTVDVYSLYSFLQKLQWASHHTQEGCSTSHRRPFVRTQISSLCLCCGFLLLASCFFLPLTVMRGLEVCFWLRLKCLLDGWRLFENPLPAAFFTTLVIFLQLQKSRKHPDFMQQFPGVWWWQRRKALNFFQSSLFANNINSSEERLSESVGLYSLLNNSSGLSPLYQEPLNTFAFSRTALCTN